MMAHLLSVEGAKPEVEQGPLAKISIIPLFLLLLILIMMVVIAQPPINLWFSRLLLQVKCPLFVLMRMIMIWRMMIMMMRIWRMMTVTKDGDHGHDHH